MRNRFSNKKVNILMIILTCFITSGIFAQYQLFQWTNFEKGKMPDKYIPIGEDFENNVKVVEYNKLTNLPPEFDSGIAGKEIGKYGLQITVNPALWIIGLSDLSEDFILDRNRLGEKGKALYQADFFVPAPGEVVPNIAVLAMEPMVPGEKKPRSFYRFGMTENRHVYFSYVVQDEKNALDYKFDEALFRRLPRPGWHRFAIVFEGPSRIHCYIDGQEVYFDKPVEESTIQQLRVGVMLANKKKDDMVYVDNLSIQWTNEDYPIPASPYVGSWGETFITSAPQSPVTAPEAILPGMEAAAQLAASIQAVSTPSASAPLGPPQWLDTETGWRTSTATKIPMLVYFSAPNVPSVEQLDSVFSSDSDSQRFVRKYIPVKIDVNQLQGGQLAKKFGIFKLPSIVIMDSTGKEITRAIYGKNDNWQTFSAKLQIQP